MIRIAAIGQEVIQNNEKTIADIKKKYDDMKAIPDDSKDPEADKDSASKAAYEASAKDA